MIKDLASVIILNYNGEAILDECLSAISRQTYRKTEVLVVDNASTDKSISIIKKYPCKLILNKENYGFAKGNNIGISKARGEFILLLNNDTKADKRWVEELVRAAKADETIGSCACKMVYYDRPDVINSAGLVMTKGGYARDIGYREKDGPEYDMQKQVFGSCGGAVLYRRKMLDDIGLLDEDFSFYWEDVDLAWRAQLGGWSCVYVPAALVKHRVSYTIDRISGKKRFLYHRNRVYALIKNMSRSTALLYSPFLLAAEVFSVLYAIFTREWEVISGRREALKGISKMLEKRKEIQAKRRRPEREIREFFETGLF